MSNSVTNVSEEYDVVDIPTADLVLCIPGVTSNIPIETLSNDTFLEVRHFLLETAHTVDLTNYHFEHEGLILNEYLEISSYPQLMSTGEKNDKKKIDIIFDKYDEKTSKDHLKRFRDILTHGNTTNVNCDFLPEALADLKNLTNTTKDIEAAKKRLLTKGKKGGKGVKITKDFSNDIVSQIPSISTHEFYRSAVPDVNNCVQNITFSVWNPMSSTRRMFGEYFYIDVTLLEGKTVTITASTKGFFLNNSSPTRFDANPVDSEVFHSLSALLSKYSPQFVTQWNKLLNRKFSCHPLEVQTVTVESPTWCTLRKAHKPNWNEADVHNHHPCGEIIPGHNRNWNDEIALCHSLPKEQPQERFTRDRTYTRLMSEFNENAIKGAVAVIEGHISPLNPIENKREHVYIYNNIFFCIARDISGQLQDLGGDTTARQIANNDLQIVSVLIDNDLDVVSYSPIVVVDYMGYKITAQGIIPGILTGDVKHVSGYFSETAAFAQPTEDNVNDLEDVKNRLDKLGEFFHIENVQLKTEDDDAVENCIGGDTKILSASDKQLYLLDTMYLLPRDSNYKEPHQMGFRHTYKAVVSYCRHQALMAVNEIRSVNDASDAKIIETKRKEWIEANKETIQKINAYHKKMKQVAMGEIPPEEAPSPEDEPTIHFPQNHELLGLSDEEIAARVALYKDTYTSTFRNKKFAVDVYSTREKNLVMTQEELDSARKNIDDLSHYVKNTLVHHLVRDLTGLINNLSGDGEVLTTSMTDLGLPSRYLGHVYNHCMDINQNTEENDQIKTVLKPIRVSLGKTVKNEMIARGATYVLNSLLSHFHQDISKYINADNVADLLSKFLSALTTDTISTVAGAGNGLVLSEDIIKASADIMSQHDQYNVEYSVYENSTQTDIANALPPSLNIIVPESLPSDLSSRLHPANIRTAVLNMVNSVYEQNFDMTLFDSLLHDDRKAILRRICQKSGVIVFANNFDFSASTPIAINDIASINPVSKTVSSSSRDAKELISLAYKQFDNEEYQNTFVSANEAISLIMQTSGTLCRSLLDILPILSQLFLLNNEIDMYLDCMLKAIIILEKNHGTDNYYIVPYLNQIAFSLISVEKPLAALKYLNRALFIVENNLGLNNTDAFAIKVNIALTMFNAKRDNQALLYMKDTVDRVSEMFGKNHVYITNYLENYGNMLYLMGDYERAHEQMTKCLDIMKENTPEEDQTTDSEISKYNRLIEQIDTCIKISQRINQPGENQKKFIEIMSNIKKENETTRVSPELISTLWVNLPSYISPTRRAEAFHELEKVDDDVSIKYEIGSTRKQYKKKDE